LNPTCNRWRKASKFARIAEPIWYCGIGFGFLKDLFQFLLSGLWKK
ncbi:MAG: hypothetical protein ACI81T_002899, partial [Bacteroidia bacterium]